jgi:hypothetical protein
MSSGPSDDAKSIDASGFDALERSTGISGFKLDEDSRHRLEWALFWARTGQAKKAEVDIANLIIELAVQYGRAARKSVLLPNPSPESKPRNKAKEPAFTDSFFAFVKHALTFVPEAGKQLMDQELREHVRRALAAAMRQKDDPKSRLPDERREELNTALAK